MLAVQKTRKPTLYELPGKPKISASQFFEDCALNQLGAGNKHEFNWEWYRDMLDFYLMSDTELETATSDGNTQVRQHLKQFRNQGLGTAGKNIIPQPFSKLDRFSLQPL